MTSHLARHALERWIADDPQAPLLPALRAHGFECDYCSTRKRALEASNARYLAMHPAPNFARSVVALATARAAAPAWAWLGWNASRLLVPAAGVLATAAALSLWFAPAPQRPDTIRSKGGVSLQAIAQHHGTRKPLRDGDALSAGDQLAFQYALDKPWHLLLLGIDDGGAITRYYPATGANAVPLAATQRAQLPVGIELDARKGEERLYAFFSETALDERAARTALAHALATARASRGGIATLSEIELPAQQISVWFRKP